MGTRLDVVLYSWQPSDLHIQTRGMRWTKRVSFYRVFDRIKYSYKMERIHPAFLQQMPRLGFYDSNTHIEVDFYIDSRAKVYSLASLIFNCRGDGIGIAQRSSEMHICKFHKNKFLTHRLTTTTVRHMAKVARALIDTFTFIGIQINMQANDAAGMKKITYDNNVIRKAMKQFKLPRKGKANDGTKVLRGLKGCGRQPGLVDQISSPKIDCSTVTVED